ncbi:DUF4157 domain-containing protein [Kitasatospora sp. NPDC048722]|uniref:eCIS core domain-containing protein n=1 Tax=Kitasatospora sp. NPDC048722 TaxID=3155639 RepID=UPI003406AD5A
MTAREFAEPADRTPVLRRCGTEACGCGTDEPQLRRHAAGDGPAFAPPEVRAVLGSPGAPLDAEVRELLEPRFGQDFSAVRVHTDDRAAASAEAVRARAYTVGADIVFASGRYAPHTAEGRHLLAHELAHVVQQRQAGPGLAAAPLEVGASCTTR